MKVLLRLAAEAKKYKGLFIVSALSTLLISAVNLTAPGLMARMTALVSQGLNSESLIAVIRLAVILLCLYLSRILFRYLSNFLAHKAAWNLVKEFRIKVYCKLQAMSPEYYRRQESGDLVSRTINDTATFELLYAHQIPESITNIITVVGVTAILLSINPVLALLTCFPIPLILLSGRILIKKIRPHFRETQKTLGKLSAQLQDNFSGMQEIQAFGQQEISTRKVTEKADVFTRHMLKALNLSAVFHPSVEFLTALGVVIVVGFGGYLAYLGNINVEDIVAFLLYLTLFYVPITGFAQLLEQMQQSLAGAERVIEVLDSPETIRNTKDAVTIENPCGELCFKHVSFSYTDNVPVLEDISFRAAPGETVAIVGATGVGKSTLARLTARFYDPTEGVIEMDGYDLRTVDLESLRRNVAMVLQETFLFNGTIAENITFARPGASLEEIEEAARIARIHEEISDMPDGYQTVVGERGARLSGGQKQRIAIARAVLSKAPVLILDEATASVDVKTESHIQNSILELAGTHTVIVIAHRLSTVRRADRILVFENGRISQSGTHDELINTPGVYREMCMSQITSEEE
ncbi:MAG: ABC transporter ATP-binding protein/permease [Oscillospiraceae bacterium]|nr:ABC transporter ATP-binding protein/permease [Oscillospiraceae bacterium]